MKGLIGIALGAALLGGCASLPGLPPGPGAGRECPAQLGQEQELQMNMVRDMIRKGACTRPWPTWKACRRRCSTCARKRH